MKKILDNNVINLEEYRKKLFDKFVYQGLHFIMKWAGKIKFVGMASTCKNIKER